MGARERLAHLLVFLVAKGGAKAAIFRREANELQMNRQSGDGIMTDLVSSRLSARIVCGTTATRQHMMTKRSQMNIAQTKHERVMSTSRNRQTRHNYDNAGLRVTENPLHPRMRHAFYPVSTEGCRPRL